MRSPPNRFGAGSTGALAAAGLLWLAGCSGSSSSPGEATLSPATQSGDYLHPRDSVPDSTGQNFYFVAADPKAVDKFGESTGASAVFKVAASGGAAQKIAGGLLSPIAIAISDDDQTLFIADLGGGSASAEVVPGAIYTVSSSGGAPTLLQGTEGYAPRALDVAGGDLYFTGQKDGVPGVYKIGTGGGMASAVLSGAPLQDPSGIAVVSGDVYVADSLAHSKGTGLGSVLKISGGSASEFVGGLKLGLPAGIAATQDGKTLAVSAQERDTNGSAVYLINVDSKSVTVTTKGLESSADSGGLHRAKKADVMSWCGVTVGSGGTVFRVEFK